MQSRAPDLGEARARRHRETVRTQVSRRLGQVGLVVLCSSVLLLALRFCGRSYPGWYFPNSNVLNGLLNDTIIFTVIGYDLVIVGAAAALARIYTSPSGGAKLRRSLRAVKATALALVVAIICYGIWWAAAMERLPWQPDAEKSDFMLGMLDRISDHLF